MRTPQYTCLSASIVAAQLPNFLAVNGAQFPDCCSICTSTKNQYTVGINVKQSTHQKVDEAGD